jgi:hypothetical protein
MTTTQRLSAAFDARLAALAAQLVKQRAEIKARVERSIAA